MRSVSTLAATGAGISLSAIGLTLGAARPANDDDGNEGCFTTSESQPDMTAVATYTVDIRSRELSFTTHRSFSTPLALQQGGGERERTHGKTPAQAQSDSSARTGQKRSLTPRLSTTHSDGSERAVERRDVDGTSSLYPSTPSGRPINWLRRLSSNMTAASRDSSRTPTSRPSSAAVSQSTGSAAFSFSHTGSTTPMLPDITPPPLPRNRLVKRTSSLHTPNTSSPVRPPDSSSKLPLPVFRRPATSHQRSATLQESFVNAEYDEQMSLGRRSQDLSWRHYFTPKVAADDISSDRRQSSTGIPNLIKRVYPDRKYTPVLISARESVRAAMLEVDDGAGADDSAVSRLKMLSSTASSPLPVQTSHFGESSIPRRSFSIGDLLATGAQPLWKRPSASKGRLPPSTMAARRAKSRVVSAPQTSMGSAFSAESERPAKRRDVTDPHIVKRDIYSSSSTAHPQATPSANEIQLALSESSPGSHSFSFDSPDLNSLSQTASPTNSFPRRLPSATVESSAARHARVSATQSEITSTVGSENGRRSLSGYSTDYQSDAIYDSIRTRTTVRSSSGKRGPPIDTIFDESPPQFSSGQSTTLRDLLHDGSFSGSNEHSRHYRHSTIEEEDSMVSTPVRLSQERNFATTPSARPGAQQMLMSSPPAEGMPDPDDMDWDADDNTHSTKQQQGLGIQHHAFGVPNSHLPERSFPFRLNALSRPANTISAASTPNRNGGDRANPFDWSEQQPSPSHVNQSPPRPRTVHGKKDPENRGSRAPARRAASGMHARSHSVPVVPDVDGKRSNVVANKFGTWGVGSKAVTEDWDEDFDFDNSAAPPLPGIVSAEDWDERRIDSGHEMFVPKSIREQQDNVVANISLLREWGLLIEELKELRVRAVALDMLQGPHAMAWQEVDAMIELADQESEEHTLQPRRSPPSSPGLDFDDFDEPIPELPGLGARVQVDGPLELQVPVPVTGRASPYQNPNNLSATRPRKDSEAVARSVIEALQSKRSVSDSAAALKSVQAAPPTRKVPFDTGTLRHIVPYVNGLKKKVKEALRETEGLYSSPRRRTPPREEDESGEEGEEGMPAFRSMFKKTERQSESPKRTIGKGRRDWAITDHIDDSDGDEDSGDLIKKLQGMRLAR